MKVLLVTTTNMDEVMEFIKQGNEYPKQYLWGYDGLGVGDIEITPLKKPVGKTWIDVVNKVFRIRLLRLQLKCIRESKNYDLIYINIDAVYRVLMIARLLRIVKTPLFAVSHHSFSYKKIPFGFQKLNVMLDRFLSFAGVDKIVYCSKRLLNLSSASGKIPKRHNNFIEWGGDTQFYYPVFCEKKSDKLKILSVGHTNRDYPVLIKAVSGLNCELKIHSLSANINVSELPENVFIDEELRKEQKDNNLTRFLGLREAYNWADVVAISIRDVVYNPNGATVLFEAISSGKPVIMTNNISLPIDVEIEGIGFKVAYNDVIGWENAIKYYINNPDMVKEMGLKARMIAEQSHNYFLYKEMLYEQMKSFIDNEIKKHAY